MKKVIRNSYRMPSQKRSLPIKIAALTTGLTLAMTISFFNKAFAEPYTSNKLPVANSISGDATLQYGTGTVDNDTGNLSSTFLEINNTNINDYINPVNGELAVMGSMLVSPTTGADSVLNVKVNSSVVDIGHNSFNVGVDNKVNFHFSGADQTVINRVTVDQSPSVILGSITQTGNNGSVFLLNPNGILFGNTGSVNLNSFFATTFVSDDFSNLYNINLTRNSSNAGIYIDSGFKFGQLTPGSRINLVSAGIYIKGNGDNDAPSTQLVTNNGKISLVTSDGINFNTASGELTVTDPLTAIPSDVLFKKDAASAMEVINGAASHNTSIHLESGAELQGRTIELISAVDSTISGPFAELINLDGVITANAAAPYSGDVDLIAYNENCSPTQFGGIKIGEDAQIVAHGKDLDEYTEGSITFNTDQLTIDANRGYGRLQADSITFLPKHSTRNILIGDINSPDNSSFNINMSVLGQKLYANSEHGINLKLGYVPYLGFPPNPNAYAGAVTTSGIFNLLAQNYQTEDYIPIWLEVATNGGNVDLDINQAHSDSIISVGSNYARVSSINITGGTDLDLNFRSLYSTGDITIDGNGTGSISLDSGYRIDSSAGAVDISGNSLTTNTYSAIEAADSITLVTPNGITFGGNISAADGSIYIDGGEFIRAVGTPTVSTNDNPIMLIAKEYFATKSGLDLIPDVGNIPIIQANSVNLVGSSDEASKCSITLQPKYSSEIKLSSEASVPANDNIAYIFNNIFKDMTAKSIIIDAGGNSLNISNSGSGFDFVKDATDLDIPLNLTLSTTGNINLNISSVSGGSSLLSQSQLVADRIFTPNISNGIISSVSFDKTHYPATVSNSFTNISDQNKINIIKHIPIEVQPLETQLDFDTNNQDMGDILEEIDPILANNDTIDEIQNATEIIPNNAGPAGGDISNSDNTPRKGFSNEAEAQVLHDLGLYQGISETAFDPDLGAALNRETGVVMLLRLFGISEEAQMMSDAEADTILSEFSDADSISGWARKSVAYAVKNDLVNGLTDEQFGAKSALNGKGYCALILRQLGYTPDYDNSPAELAGDGLTVTSSVKFTQKELIKDDSAGIENGALKKKYSEGATVIEKLVEPEILLEEPVESQVDIVPAAQP